MPKIAGDEQSLVEEKKRPSIIYDKSTRILVVDDNAINLHIASGMLETVHSLRCDLVSSGPEALEKARRNDYHIIFIDQLMPGMDGPETAARIRALGGNNETVPIIAFAGSTDACDALPAASMNDFLTKPIQKDELDAILFRWLPHSQRIGKRDSDGSVRMDENRHHEFLARFAGIEDIDAAKGLGNAAEQCDAYENSLRLLCDRLPSLSLQLQDALSDGNLKDFSIHIHSLKNTLASVGADPLSKLALSIEKASTAGLARLTHLANTLKRVLADRGAGSR